MVEIRRIAKVITGGRKRGFRALVVVGNGNGIVGIGISKAQEIPEAIRKASSLAKKNLIRVPLSGSTIPHEIQVKFGATEVLLRPAAPGTGLIASGPIRVVLESCGIRDILSKSLGSNNPINVCQATILALSKLVDPKEELARRGVSVDV